MKLGWCTDVHLDYLSPYRCEGFLNEVSAIGADSFIITGDISTANKLEGHLSAIALKANVPVYYVLGNHDYWEGSIKSVRALTIDLEKKYPNLIYLGNRSYVKLTDKAALVGHDGWYDAIYGDWRKSHFEMPDWYLIEEFRDAQASEKIVKDKWIINFPNAVNKSRDLAQFCAEHIEKSIQEAIAAGFKQILIASLVPAFEESHMHEGKRGSDTTMCWFTSGLLGDVVMTAAISNPDIVFTIFSGHTHGDYRGSITHNLHAYVGGARYGRPCVQTTVHL